MARTNIANAGDGPIDTGSPDRSKNSAEIRQMFGAISGTYDLLNRSLSAGMDAAWRRRAVACAGVGPADRVLDVGTGTGDLAAAFAARPGQRGRIVGVDFAAPMLALAHRKTIGTGRLSLIQGDALSLPFRDEAFDVVSAAFSLRNVADLALSLSELGRVLRPSGRFVLLEFLRPARMGWPLRFYLRRILPAIGARVSGHPSAYAYLRDSQEAFLTLDGVRRQIESCGFEIDRAERLFPGLAYVIIARRLGAPERCVPLPATDSSDGSPTAPALPR